LPSNADIRLDTQQVPELLGLFNLENVMEKKKKLVLKKQSLTTLTNADIHGVVGAAPPKCPCPNPTPVTPGNPDPFPG
jgi:hypothetical protein